MIANRAVLAATSGVKRTAWKRYVALFLEGCRAERAHALPEPPLSGRQMFRAMLALSARHQDE